MPVEAIGNTLGDQTANLSSTTLNQEDFLRLFLTELNFQDPLEPINNREFLAQIAQFAGLEQDRQTTQSVNDLILVNSSSQSVGLLDRQVDYRGNSGELSGTVSAVTYTRDGAILTINSANNFVDPNVRLSQIIRVK